MQIVKTGEPRGRFRGGLPPALPRRKGLRHEVDKLRREYLAERIGKTGR